MPAQGHDADPRGCLHHRPCGGLQWVTLSPSNVWSAMSSTTRVEAPGDAELISAVRGGDTDAYGVLFERHVEAARRLARQLVSAGDVEDLVSEAFVKVLQVLQRGGGPDVAFRAYLLTAVRRLRVDRLRATSRLHTTDDMEMFDPGVPFRDTAVEGFESATAARAFASLPERWQLVLWHTEVEGQKPADVAPLLGMSANSVSALAYRAREGLRQAYLNEHASELDDESCQWTKAHLGAYIRNGISRRDAGKVEDHLGHCRTCAAIYLELSEVNSNLGAVLAPLLLGGVGAAYAASATGAAAPVGLLGLLDRARDLVAGHSQVAAVVGVTSVVAIGGGTFLALQDGPPPPAAVSGEQAGSPRAGDDAGSLAARSPSAGDGSSTRVSVSNRAGRTAGVGATTASTDEGSTDPADAATPGADTTPDAGTDPTAASPQDTPGTTTDPTTGATGSPTGTEGPTSGTTTQGPGPGGAPTSAAAPPTAAGNPTTTGGGTPTQGPATGPASTPAATPPAEPTAPPAPPSPVPTTDAPPPRNLAVSVAVRALNSRTAELSGAVTGVRAGESVTVEVSGRLVNFQSTDARCVDAAVMRCTVTDARPFAVLAVAANLDPVVTFTVLGAAGPGNDPADDSVRVTWD
jgi:RNA polymerase sigma factor (sigma-70 family)